MEQVVLVNEAGRRIGTQEKVAAHRDGGQLHLAFCVFIFRPGGEVLLQRRADSKYHFSGLWSNACCGHPRPGEGVVAAGERRLREEFGFAAGLRPVTRFVYQADDAVSGLAEHELAHVLVGRVEALQPRPDPMEIGGWRWLSPRALDAEVQHSPERFTPWFRHMVTRYSLVDWLP